MSSKEAGLYCESVRRWRGINQNELAALSGLSRRHLGRWLRGEGSGVSLAAFSSICAALELDLRLHSEKTPWDGPRTDLRPWASSARSDWAVPRDLVDWTSAELGPVVLDVCANESNRRAPKWIDAEQDCRKKSWGLGGGKVAWMNPPFGVGADISSFLQAAAANAHGMGWTVAVFLPFRSSARWWISWVDGMAAEVWMLQGRVKLEAEGRGQASSCPFEPCIAIYRDSPPLFGTRYTSKAQPQGWTGWRKKNALSAGNL